MLGIHGTKAYLCVVKGYSRQGMSGKERSWFYFPVVLSRFCPVRDLYHDTWFRNIAEYQWFANDRSEKNALTTSNHQNGPCEPVNVASQRNSLVWNITSSISCSRILIPKSERMFESAMFYCVTMLFSSESSVSEPPELLPKFFFPASRHRLIADDAWLATLFLLSSRAASKEEVFRLLLSWIRKEISVSFCLVMSS